MTKWIPGLIQSWVEQINTDRDLLVVKGEAKAPPLNPVLYNGDSSSCGLQYISMLLVEKDSTDF
jgi:hypothetical protein